MSGTALPTDGRSRFDERPNRPSVDNAHRASWRPRIGDRFNSARQVLDPGEFRCSLNP